MQLVLLTAAETSLWEGRFFISCLGEGQKESLISSSFWSLAGLRGNWWIVFVCFTNVTEVSWLKIKKINNHLFKKEGKNWREQCPQTGAHGSLAGLH